jgi:hypothetical protein
VPRRPDPLDGKRQVIERCRPITGGILHGQACDAGRHTACDAVSHFVRLNAVTRRKVGIHRQVDRGGNLGDMGQAPFTRDGDV